MKRIVISILYLLILFLVSHYIFDPTYLYYEIWWLDIPMHILGGLGVASLTHGIFLYFGKHTTFLKIFIVYTLVALAWELSEYIQNMITYQMWSGWLDTVKDYVDGLFGAALFYRFLPKK